MDNLTRHFDLVRDACILLGKGLMAQGHQEFGRILFAYSFEHYVSKFAGIEWDYLHTGRDVPKEQLELAVRQHVRTNTHHPEYWGGLDNLPEIAIAEMVCDWYARSQEFGTGLREWITSQAIERFTIDVDGERYGWVQKFVALLLEDSFVR